MLDVGTGSGALAVTLQLETRRRGLGDGHLARGARRGSGECAAAGRARWTCVVCDLMDAVAPRSMDLIVSNPPVRAADATRGLQREVRDFEPHVALFAGDTGFEIYERIVADARAGAAPGGWLVMELGFASRDQV